MHPVLLPVQVLKVSMVAVCWTSVKTEWICRPRFGLLFFLLVFTIVRCFLLFHFNDRVSDCAYA